MDISKLAEQVNDLKAKVNSLKHKIKETCEEFFKDTEEFLCEQFKEIVEYTRNANAKLVEKRGEKGMSGFRADLEDLTRVISIKVKAHLGKNEYWPHLRELPDPSEADDKLSEYLDFKEDLPSDLDRDLREMFNYLGNLLGSHGFIDIDRDNEWEKHPLYGDKVKYKGKYTPSKEMITTFGYYRDQLKELIKLNDELKKVEKEKSKAIVKNY